MNNDRKKLSKEELKAKLDTLGEEIKYRVSEAKKADGTGVGSAHKTDIEELMKGYRSMKEAYDKVLRTEQESLQLEDILASLAEEKEEDPKKVEEREELHKSRVESFSELIDLVTKIKSALPKAKKETEQYYKKNPKSFAVVFSTDEIKDSLSDILTKLTGEEVKEEENTEE
jgi:tRNA A37 N6-isopentenylltransferase MiaA